MRAKPDLDALRRNEPAERERLYSWLSPILIRQAVCHLPDFPWQDAEEVAWEALRKLSAKIMEAESLEKLEAFGKRITKHLCIDHRRNAIAQKRGSGLGCSLDHLREESDGAIDAVESDRTDEEVLNRERRAIVRAVLQRINPPLRDILSEIYFSAYSYAEVAEIHGLQIGSVGVYLTRAKKAFKSERGRDVRLDELLRILIVIPAQLFAIVLRHL